MKNLHHHCQYHHHHHHHCHQVIKEERRIQNYLFVVVVAFLLYTPNTQSSAVTVNVKRNYSHKHKIILHYLPVIIPYVLCVLLHKLLLLVVIIILRVLARDVSNRQIHTPFTTLSCRRREQNQ